MSKYCQSQISTSPDRAILAFQPVPGPASSVWPMEPSFAEMMRDPVVLQLMASDRVSMECFTGLVSTVRQRLRAKGASL